MAAPVTRRAALGGISAGLAVSVSQKGHSQVATNTGNGGDNRNPVDRYPVPPFPDQSQEWPGLAGQMKPRPDHGETSYRGSGRLLGRKALVTGGDSGIGRAAAIAFAREGADVGIGFLPAEAPDALEVQKIIEQEGRKALLLPGDIRREDFCRELVNRAATELGGLDILVNNAAKQHAVASLEDISTEQFEATFLTNMFATFWITRAALPHLKAGSAIINTASIVAFDPPDDLVDYAATKAAILNFTRSLSKQLAPKGIRVNAVAPGPVWTPLQPSGGQLPGKLAKFGADTPLGRPGQPAEFGGIYVLLASDDASFTTGQVYGATGGRTGP